MRLGLERHGPWLGAVMLVMAAATCQAQAIDCWLLDGQALDRAHERGLCQDAFARNSVGGAPASGEPVVVPRQRDSAPHGTTDSASRGTIDAASRGREVAAIPRPRPAAPRKPTREAASPPQPATAPPHPSWSAPRPPQTVARPEETAEAPAGPPAVRRPPPPAAPVAVFVDNFQRDFRSLMDKLVTGR